MKRLLFALFALVWACVIQPARAADSAPAKQADDFEDLAKALITIEVSRREYDYIQPWSRKVEQNSKFGIILNDREILTTADHLGHRTLVRLQKQGRGRWWRGSVAWINYHANLALLTADESEFWDGTKSLELIDKTPHRGDVQMARWRSGLLDVRNETITRMLVKKSKLSFLEYAQLEVESEVSGTGWAEPILAGGKLVGISASKESQSLTVIPASFIRQTLEARASKREAGYGYFAFVWQRGENPALLRHLGLKGEERGVVVVEVPPGGETNSVRVKDIILEIDGFKIDTQGDYVDPEFGTLSLENLATRGHWAGDVINLKTLREGKEMTVQYKLPRADYDVDLVPIELFEKEPEYVMMGGFLFVPLTEPLLRSWSGDWRRKAPFRLSYYTREKAIPGRQSLVVLSGVLPDPINIGYQDLRYLVVEEMNGKTIRTLSDLQEARKSPKDGFHVINFRQGESVHRVALDSAQLDRATSRIQQRYGIIAAEHIEAKPRAAAP